MQNDWVLVASGPSLTQSDCALIRNARHANKCRVLVVNDNWRRVPNYDVLYACDHEWWDRYYKDLPKGGRLCTQDGIAAERYALEHWPSENMPGLCTVPGKLHQGSNSGYQALNLAYHLGAERIALIGYDMQLTDGHLHWFGTHPQGMRNPSSIKSWAKHFVALSKDLAREGVDVTNCTRQTALTCFNRMSIEQWLTPPRD